MPTLPRHLKLPSAASKARTLFLGSLNFYRVHLMVFTLVSLSSPSRCAFRIANYSADYTGLLGPAVLLRDHVRY